MPAAIVGGVSFMLYGMISAIGVRNVVENKVDLTKSRNLIIAARHLWSAAWASTQWAASPSRCGGRQHQR